MKLINSILKGIVFLICVLLLQNSAKALPQDSTCCDSAGFYLEPLNSYPDSCNGFVHFWIDSNQCDLDSFTFRGSRGPVIFDSVSGNLKRAYSFPKGTKGIITVYYLNSSGDTLCVKADSVFCPADTSICCDSMGFYLEQDSSSADSCKGRVHVWIGTNPCDITNFAISGTSGLIYWEYGNRYYSPYSFLKGTAGAVTVYYLNSYGDTLCIKSDTIFCPADSCCKSLGMYIVPDNQSDEFCCGTVYFYVGENRNCNVSNVYGSDNIETLEWNPEANAYAGRYCVHRGESALLTGYFIGENNDIICVKEDSVYCTEDFCCDRISIIDYPIFGDGGECCGELHIDIDEQIQCNIVRLVVDNEEYDYQNFVFPYCIFPYTSIRKVFYFIAANGDTLCTKVWERNCDGYEAWSFSTTINSMDDFLLYPNPAQDKLTIEVDRTNYMGKIIASIINKEGASVYQGEIKDEVLNIDISELYQGIYVLRLSGDNINKTKKFSIIK